MKLFLTCAIFFLGLIQPVFATEFFKGTYSEAMEKASRENKKVLLYFTAKWCGPCQVMQRNAFPSDSITSIIDADYVALKIDKDSHSGERLSKQFSVQGLPTILIIDSTGTVVGKKLGYKNVRDLYEFLSSPIDKPNSHVSHAVTGSKIESSTLKIFPLEIGVRLGAGYNDMTNSLANGGFAFQADLFASLEYARFLIRPGIGYTLRGNDEEKLKSLMFPIDIGYTLYKSAIFGFPGGVRIIASPYYSILLNDVQISKNDFGFRSGIATYIGESSKLEAMLLFERGLTDLNNTETGKQHSQGVMLSLSLTL